MRLQACFVPNFTATNLHADEALRSADRAMSVFLCIGTTLMTVTTNRQHPALPLHSTCFFRAMLGLQHTLNISTSKMSTVSQPWTHSCKFQPTGHPNRSFNQGMCNLYSERTPCDKIATHRLCRISPLRHLNRILSSSLQVPIQGL
jgi:hypothetical protein